MAVEPAAATLARHPRCCFTQDGLVDLLAKCNIQGNGYVFDDYFFRGRANCPNPQLQDLIDDGDNLVRCRECCNTIGRHGQMSPDEARANAHLHRTFDELRDAMAVVQKKSDEVYKEVEDDEPKFAAEAADSRTVLALFDLRNAGALAAVKRLAARR